MSHKSSARKKTLRRKTNRSKQSPVRHITFHLADVFPPEDPLTLPLLRLMMAVNDVRHIQKLLLLAISRLKGANEFQKLVMNGEMLHLDRMLCGHLYEAGVAFRSIDRSRPDLADMAVAKEPAPFKRGLQKVRDAYASDTPGAFHYSFLKPVRDSFGFHYKSEAIEARLMQHVSKGDLDGNILIAGHSGLGRYVIGDHLAIGMIQQLLGAEIKELSGKYTETTGHTMDLARHLTVLVDLILFQRVQSHESDIRIKEGTVPIPREIGGGYESNWERAVSEGPDCVVL